MKINVLSCLLVGALCVSAQAGLYSFNYTDSGAIPQGGTVFSAEHTVSISDIPNPYVTQLELILTFNENTSLAGNGSGIQGRLNLGTISSSPYLTFNPVATSSSGGQYIYDVTFSGSPGSPGSGFNGLDPNGTWGLVLWDSTSGIQNSLAGWSLDITAVPEPVNVALAVFAGLAVLVKTGRLVRAKINQ